MSVAILLKMLPEIHNSKNKEIYEERSFNCPNEVIYGVQIGKVKKFENSRHQFLTVFSAIFPTAGMEMKFIKIKQCTGGSILWSSLKLNQYDPSLNC